MFDSHIKVHNAPALLQEKWTFMELNSVYTSILIVFFCCCSWKDVIITILPFRGGAKFANCEFRSLGFCFFLLLLVFLQIILLAFVYLFVNTVFLQGTSW